MTLESVDDVERIAVIGAGQMGRGIAAVSALAGYETTMHDIDESQLQDGLDHAEWSYGKQVDRDNVSRDEADAAVERLSDTTDLESAVADADVVTEAAAEQLSVKETIFADVDEMAPDHAVLTTNTSGLHITKLAETTDRPERVLGTHWFNPPMLMDLVEVITTEHADPAYADLLEDLVESFGKTPIRCKRDVPNFIVNRCMRPYGEAAGWLAHFGVADVEQIDSAMKYREDFPMGPFELGDYTGGIQIRVEGEEDHLNDPRPLNYDTRYNPLVHDLYEQGHYGRKAGRGFYDYSDQDEPDIDPEAGEDVDTLLVWAPVINEAAKMVQHDVASVEDVDVGMELGGNWPVGPLAKCDEVGAEAVVRSCVEVAGMHERIENLAEVLPCDLLVEKATSGETFY